jgi:hypothetical protein
MPRPHGPWEGSTDDSWEDLLTYEEFEEWWNTTYFPPNNFGLGTSLDQNQEATTSGSGADNPSHSNHNGEVEGDQESPDHGLSLLIWAIDHVEGGFEDEADSEANANSPPVAPTTERTENPVHQALDGNSNRNVDNSNSGANAHAGQIGALDSSSRPRRNREPSERHHFGRTPGSRFNSRPSSANMITRPMPSSPPTRPLPRSPRRDGGRIVRRSSAPNSRATQTARQSKIARALEATIPSLVSSSIRPSTSLNANQVEDNSIGEASPSPSSSLDADGETDSSLDADGETDIL